MFQDLGDFITEYLCKENYQDFPKYRGLGRNI